MSDEEVVEKAPTRVVSSEVVVNVRAQVGALSRVTLAGAEHAPLGDQPCKRLLPLSDQEQGGLGLGCSLISVG